MPRRSEASPPPGRPETPRKPDLPSPRDRMRKELQFIYGEEVGNRTFARLEAKIAERKRSMERSSVGREVFPGLQPLGPEATTIITYPDSLSRKGEKPLQTLDHFLATQVDSDTVKPGVHILPFNPSSSDRGFSVIDYSIVDPAFGDWGDIQNIAGKRPLMAELVLNHVSAKSKWFQGYLAGEPKYKDYFISFKPGEEPTKEEQEAVFRPRPTSFLTPYETADGERLVWTTFSTGADQKPDQIDLKYANPEVFLEMADVYMNGLENGADIVRLDAPTYIWKELGTDCKSRPQGHSLVRTFRAITEEVKPSARIITETNVPHAENISYFGTGEDEAHMVYNFALPPMTVHAFATGQAADFSRWAATLDTPSDQTTYFNMLSTHDGIGVGGARGVLPEPEVDKVVDWLLDHGGKPNMKIQNGVPSVYEIPCTWWDALNKPGDNPELARRKFMTSHAIAASLPGMSAVYYGSLVGLSNDTATWERTKHNRDLVRENLDADELTAKLANPNSREAKVLQAQKKLMADRASHPAFAPNAPHKVLDLDKRVFSIMRESPQGNVLALHNVSGDTVEVEHEGKKYKLEPFAHSWEPLPAAA